MRQLLYFAYTLGGESILSTFNEMSVRLKNFGYRMMFE